jgi:hypothetical protein
MSSVHAQQQQQQRLQLQLLADTTTTTHVSSFSSSVLGKGHVEEKNAEGLVVSLRRGEEVQEREQRLGPRPGQEGEEGQEAAVKEEGGRTQGEVPLAPDKNSLDAQAVADWTMPVEWTGKVRERNVAGADVGNRLYAGKKRMFKGHKWERTRERRVGRTKMLLRDMDERIQRFKGVRQIFGTGPILPPPFHPPPRFQSSFFLFADGFFFSFLLSFCTSFFYLVPCQGQAIAASKEEQRVEEDTEAAVLSCIEINLFVFSNNYFTVHRDLLNVSFLSHPT